MGRETVLFYSGKGFPCLSVQRDIGLLMKRELLLLQDVLTLKGETEKTVNWCFCVLKLAHGWRCLFKVGARSNLNPLNLKLLFILKDTTIRSPEVMLFPFLTPFYSSAVGGNATQDFICFWDLSWVIVSFMWAVRHQRMEKSKGLTLQGVKCPQVV